MSDHHGPGYYIKIYLILLVLFVISVLGPELGIRSVTLITAFGIAVVKAIMVAAYFMHLNVEKKYIHYMLWGMLILMAVFYSGVMIDIYHTRGQNWINVSSESQIEMFKDVVPDSH